MILILELTLLVSSSQLPVTSKDSYWKPATGNWKPYASVPTHTALCDLWSEKTTVCRIFNCQRTYVEASSCQLPATSCSSAASAASFSQSLFASLFHSSWKLGAGN